MKALVDFVRIDRTPTFRATFY